MKGLNNNDVIAIIITYNCDKRLIENIYSLLEQVNSILVIDNGSDKYSVSILEPFFSNDRIKFILNLSNKGIAYGLNQGLQYAKANRFLLILTMDQDTVLGRTALAEMLLVLQNNEEIVSIGPDRKSTKYSKKNYTRAQYLITSGNLVRVDAALDVAGFTNDFFIDSVDLDFSLKLRKKGYKLAIAKNAYMSHKVGEYEENKFMFFKIKYLSHNPMRQYYIYRNSILLTKKYVFRFPFLIVKMIFFLILDTMKIIMFEHNKLDKLKMAYKGLKDGLKRKTLKE